MTSSILFRRGLKVTLAKNQQRQCQQQQQRQSRQKSTMAPPASAAASTSTASPAQVSLDQARRRRRSFGGGLWQRYCEALANNPLLVKATTASLIFFGSDCVAQQLQTHVSANRATDDQEQGQPLTKSAFAINVPRAASGAVFGVVATTWLHYWWGFLETAVNARVSRKLPNTLVKVFADQAIGAPLYIYTYYVITNFVQSATTLRKQLLRDDGQKMARGSSEPYSKLLKDTHEKASEMLWPTMQRHWTVWPAVHTLNFYFNPLHQRVLVQNLVLVGWSGYLSHLNNGGLVTPKEEIEIEASLHSVVN